MKKPTLGLPPQLPPATPTPPAAAEQALRQMIDKGGSVAAPAPEPEADLLKSFTFKIYESELAQIRALLAARPRRDRGSIHDFVVAAVQEKLARDQG